MKATLEKHTTTDVPQREDYIAPAVNIYVLEAEMPGVTKDGLDISLEGTEITITGRRQAEKVNGQPLLRERSFADYRRVFELDPVIDTTRITAKMDQGVLRLTLPKSESVKPRKIAITE